MSPRTHNEIAKVFKAIRTGNKWSRAQLARRLKITEPKIYNMELGRTRITLNLFFAFLKLAKVDLASALSSNIFSIQSKSEITSLLESDPRKVTANLVSHFRSRLRLTQKQMGLAMGYASSSMCHHFEKGLREASADDLIKMMELAGDNVRGFILQLTKDHEIAEKFPEGINAKTEEWSEYWSEHYISAVRQIMRTDSYRNLNRYRLGYFSNKLGITVEQEQHALAVLGKLRIAKFENGKPEVDPNVKILIPQGVSKDLLTGFKQKWIGYGTSRFKREANPEDLLSIDLIPANPKTFSKVVKLIRKIQEEIHNQPFQETEGFMCLGWMASYTGV